MRKGRERRVDRRTQILVIHALYRGANSSEEEGALLPVPYRH